MARPHGHEYDEDQIQSEARRNGVERSGGAERAVRSGEDVWHSGKGIGARHDQWVSISLVSDAHGRMSSHGSK